MFAARYMKHMEAMERKDTVNNFITYVLHFSVLFFATNATSLNANSHIVFIQQHSHIPFIKIVLLWAIIRDFQKESWDQP
jgi:hypothetical protein